MICSTRNYNDMQLVLVAVASGRLDASPPIFCKKFIGQWLCDRLNKVASVAIKNEITRQYLTFIFFRGGIPTYY